MSCAPQINNMKTNGIITPIGYELGRPSFSWVVVNTTAKKQVSAQVIISQDEEFKQIVHDSGIQKNISSLDYSPENLTLNPRTRYYWKVIVQTDLEGEKIESPISFFETSKMSEEWIAKWISTIKIGQNTPPLIRKEFNLNKDKKVSKARCYVSGLGLYDLYLNNEKVGNEVLAPFYTNYNLWIQYQTYDITQQLKESKNVIGAMIGDGWARGRVGPGHESADFTGKTNDRGSPIDLAIDHYILICEIHIEYEDGTKEVIATDNSWKCHESPIKQNNIYDGECYDSTKEIEGWVSPSQDQFDDSNWTNAIIEEKPKIGNLTPRMSLPVIIKERMKPKEIIHTKTGETVIDFGQNITGWVEFVVDAPKAFEIILEHGEILQDESFFRGNLNSALQQFRYISNGKKTKIHPHFTFMGFRYVRLTKWHGVPKIDDFEACVIYSDLKITGDITTGDPLVNRFFLNSMWSQKDNFLDVPTDCPQRDERLGWTGDAQVFCSTAMFNMDCYAFYRKYLHELYKHQGGLNGSVPHYVPVLEDQSKIPFPTDGAVGWADAATVIPYMTYLYNGKKQILEEQFQSMKDWVEFVRKEVVNGLWPARCMQFGDWLGLDGPESKILNAHKFMGGTENTFLCSAYHYYSLTLLIKTAKILNEKEAEEKYTKWADETLKAIRDEYITPNGRCSIATQTAQAICIFFGLIPKEKMNTAISSLHRLLQNRDLHLCTGFLGTPILCRALSMAGNANAAYTVFLQKDYPGWLFQVTMGATTIWERWNSLDENGKVNPDGMNSFNHYAYSSVLEWIYRNVCGINPIESAPGFKEFTLEPQPDKRLKKAKAVFDSPMGKITSGWEIVNDDKNVEYIFDVPFNTKAHLKLENVKSNEVVKSSFSFEQNGKNIEAVLECGHYEISYAYNESAFELDCKFN